MLTKTPPALQPLTDQEARGLRLTGSEQRIMDALLLSYPLACHVWTLARVVWPFDIPTDDPLHRLASHVHRLRDKLAGTGWSIPARTGFRYGLERVYAPEASGSQPDQVLPAGKLDGY